MAESVAWRRKLTLSYMVNRAWKRKQPTNISSSSLTCSKANILRNVPYDRCHCHCNRSTNFHYFIICVNANIYEEENNSIEQVTEYQVKFRIDGRVQKIHLTQKAMFWFGLSRKLFDNHWLYLIVICPKKSINDNEILKVDCRNMPSKSLILITTAIILELSRICYKLWPMRHIH